MAIAHSRRAASIVTEHKQMTRPTHGLRQNDVIKTALLALIVFNVIRDPSWIQWTRDQITIVAYKIAYELRLPADPNPVFDTVETVLSVAILLIGLFLLAAALRLVRAFFRAGRTADTPVADRAERPRPRPQSSTQSRRAPPQPTKPTKPTAAASAREPTISAHGPMRDSWFPRFVVIAMILFAVVTFLRWGLP